MIKLNDNMIIHSDERDEKAIHHLFELAKNPAFENSQIRIMPDYHEGIGAVIGFTATYTDLIIPNVVGVDIGCGVISYPLQMPVSVLDFEKLDKDIRRVIPLGFNHRKTLDIFNKYNMPYNRCKDITRPLWDTYESSALKTSLQLTLNEITNNDYDFTDALMMKHEIGEPRYQLGTLGGGNHFIEIDEDQNGLGWITIHSGSRNFGLQIAKIFQNLAVYFKEKMHIDVPKELSYLAYDLGGEKYLTFMEQAQLFAKLNRRIMIREILEIMGINYVDSLLVESVHNFIDTKAKIIRKGAIELRDGQRVLIPLNMKDGVIVGTGKNNNTLKNWNFSAPHGAGRKMGRKKAKETLDMKDFKKEMNGIFSTCINEATLDEAPMAYKGSGIIKKALQPVLDTEVVMKPVYNLKA